MSEFDSVNTEGPLPLEEGIVRSVALMGEALPDMDIYALWILVDYSGSSTPEAILETWLNGKEFRPQSKKLNGAYATLVLATGYHADDVNPCASAAGRRPGTTLWQLEAADASFVQISPIINLRTRTPLSQETFQNEVSRHIVASVINRWGRTSDPYEKIEQALGIIKSELTDIAYPEGVLSFIWEVRDALVGSELEVQDLDEAIYASCSRCVDNHDCKMWYEKTMYHNLEGCEAVREITVDHATKQREALRKRLGLFKDRYEAIESMWNDLESDVTDTLGIDDAAIKAWEVQFRVENELAPTFKDRMGWYLDNLGI